MQNKSGLYNNTQLSVQGLAEPSVQVVRIQVVKDDYQNERLVIFYDICEGQYAGLFGRATKEKNNGKWWWQGTSYLSYKDELMKSFKQFITSVEESNQGYHWDWQEQTLVGKVVVCCYGTVETEIDGRTGTINLVKPRFFRSVKAFREGKVEIPAHKPLIKNTANFSGQNQNYGYTAPAQQQQVPQYQGNSSVNDLDESDTLPWL